MIFHYLCSTTLGVFKYTLSVASEKEAIDYLKLWDSKYYHILSLKNNKDQELWEFMNWLDEGF